MRAFSFSGPLSLGLFVVVCIVVCFTLRELSIKGYGQITAKSSPVRFVENIFVFDPSVEEYRNGTASYGSNEIVSKNGWIFRFDVRKGMKWNRAASIRGDTSTSLFSVFGIRVDGGDCASIGSMRPAITMSLAGVSPLFFILTVAPNVSPDLGTFGTGSIHSRPIHAL
jgi:hypothetical protein